jgi:hypothetical protein
MVIDPEGNVGIHTTSSPNYSLTVVDGAAIDKLTLTTPLAVSSGGSGVAVAPANTVFAGPTFNGATAPAFRALVNADLPSYISVANIASNGSALTGLTGSNVSGNVANATVALVVSQAAQPNITSVGLLSNLIVSNSVTTTNIFAAGFTSNSTNTVFNFDTLTIPFINSTTLNTSGTSNLSTTYITSSNVSGTSNLSTTYITSSNVSGTSNLGQVVSSGQVVAKGKSGVGVCPPIVYRQGGSATNWNTPGSNTTPNVYAITSGVVQMQCGANVMTSTTQFIPFPVSYTNNPTVLVTSYGTTGNIWVASITSTDFSVTANAAIQFEWMSIGI